MSTRTARAIAKEHLAQISKGQHPKADQRGVQVGAVETAAGKPDAQVDVTLRQAWQRYLEAHLVRKGRSETTIDGYRGHVERIFVEWLDIPLRELATDPARVARKHDDVTRQNGPYMANGSMRTLRAIYNHARKTNRSLPPDNPADAIDWNEEKRRDTGMGISDLKGWFLELADLDNPVRREFHLFTLLSGSRPAACRKYDPIASIFGDARCTSLSRRVARSELSIFRYHDRWFFVSFAQFASAGRCIRPKRESGYSQLTVH
jgi:hypothetical protein